MAAHFTIRQGDTLPPLTVSLTNEDGSTHAITEGAVVKLNYRDPSDHSQTYIRSMSVISAGSGTVNMSWSPGDTDHAADYEAEIQVEENGEVWTWPQKGYFRLRVLPQLDAQESLPTQTGIPEQDDQVDVYSQSGKFRATLNSMSMRQALGLTDDGGYLKTDMLPVAFGESFMFVPITNDPIENGLSLIAAAEWAIGQTPFGMARSASNTVKIYLLPGKYDLNGAQLNFQTLSGSANECFVDIIGLGNDPYNVFIFSSVDTSPTSTVYNAVFTSCMYQRVYGVCITNTSTNVVAHTALLQNNASAVNLASYTRMENCHLYGLNTFQGVKQGTAVELKNCALSYVLSYNTFGNQTQFYQCTQSKRGSDFGISMTSNMVAFLGCAMSTSYIIDSKVQLTDLADSPVHIYRSYVRYYSSGFNSICYLKGTVTDSDVLFSLGNDQSGVFYVAGVTWRNCNVQSVTSFVVTALPALTAYGCLITIATIPSGKRLSYNVTGSRCMSFTNCSFTWSSTMFSNYLFNPSNAGSMTLTWCTLGPGISLGANLTLDTVSVTGSYAKLP